MNNQDRTAPITVEAIAELRSLVARAKKGDRAVLPRLRQYLDINPCLWKRPGDIAIQAQAAWIKLIAGNDLYFQECLARKVNVLKQEWAGDSPSPVEVVLVERIVSAWLRVYYFEAFEAENKEESIRWAEFQLKRHALAERQFRAAMDALETVRRASRPITVELRQPVTVSHPQPTTAGLPITTPAVNGFPENSHVPHVNGVNRFAHLAAGNSNPAPIMESVNGASRVNGHSHLLGIG